MNMNLIAGKSKWELFWIPALLLNIYGLLKWSDGVTQMFGGRSRSCLF